MSTTDYTDPDIFDAQNIRKNRRLASIAATWSEKSDAELAEIIDLEDKGITITPNMTLRAAYADEARTAHNQKGNK